MWDAGVFCVTSVGRPLHHEREAAYIAHPTEGSQDAQFCPSAGSFLISLSVWTVFPCRARKLKLGRKLQILAEITALWQTDEVRVQKPLVTDEIRMGLDHYPMSIFEALPRVYEEICRFPPGGFTG